MAELTLNAVPGKTEPVEQQMLYDIAKVINFKGDELVYEFGPFFGRSTFYLAKGLSENASHGQANKLHTFDFFSCPMDHHFAPHIFNHAREASVVDLLEKKDGDIRFQKVFEHYLKDFIEDGLVTAHALSLRESYPMERSIALMHIDCPKTYKEFKNVLFRFFPLLRKGSIVIFQDYFFHWSGTLVSAVQLLAEMGILKLSFSAASSMVCKVMKQPELESLCEMDLKMYHEDLPSIIDRALDSVSNIKVHRRDHFQPRLNLAKIQLLVDSGKNALASKEINSLLKDDKITIPHVLNLSQMIERDFSYKNQ